MKIRVTTEFKDKHTNKLHKVGTEMDVPVQRVNEILSVGNFIEIIEQAEPVQTETETENETETPGTETHENEQVEPESKPPKATGGRKKTTK